jgi:hypothetical protein
MNREEILLLERRLIEGIKTSDIVLLDKLLHDDLLFMVPDGSIITKTMDLESHRKGQMVVKSLLPDFEAVSLIDDTAVVNVVYNTEGSMMGTHIKGRFRYIRIWKKFSEGIKVIGGACFYLK